jgi:anti-anti-sigma regulatory factor
MNFIIERNEQYALVEPKIDILNEDVCPELEKIVRDLYRQGYSNMILDFSKIVEIDGFAVSLIRKATKICLNESGLLIVVTDNIDIVARLDSAKIEELTIIRTIQEAADAVNLNELENDFKGEEDDEYDYGDFSEGKESDY